MLCVGVLALAFAGVSHAESGGAGAPHPETCNATDRKTEAMRHETVARLQELEALRLRVEERLARLEAETDVRMARLADLYGRMPPERAAAVVDALDPELAARILSRMRPARAAGILAALPSAHAAELSRRMVRPRETAVAATPVAETDATGWRNSSGAASAP